MCLPPKGRNDRSKGVSSACEETQVSDAYAHTVEVLEGFYHRPAMPSRKAGLRRMYKLLGLLHNPHHHFRSVHITGTAGKGSTTSMIGSILSSAGYRTGIFRSPHLVDYTERISIDRGDISQAEWVDSFEQVWPFVE